MRNFLALVSDNLFTFVSLKNKSPDTFLSTPAITFKRVVLPEPDSPRRTTSPLLGRSKESMERTSLLPYVFVKFFIVIISFIP